MPNIDLVYCYYYVFHSDLRYDLICAAHMASWLLPVSCGVSIHQQTAYRMRGDREGMILADFISARQVQWMTILRNSWNEWRYKKESNHCHGWLRCKLPPTVPVFRFIQSTWLWNGRWKRTTAGKFICSSAEECEILTVIQDAPTQVNACLSLAQHSVWEVEMAKGDPPAGSLIVGNRNAAISLDALCCSLVVRYRE